MAPLEHHVPERCGASGTAAGTRLSFSLFQVSRHCLSLCTRVLSACDFIFRVLLLRFTAPLVAISLQRLLLFCCFIVLLSRRLLVTPIHLYFPFSISYFLCFHCISIYMHPPAGYCAGDITYHVPLQCGARGHGHGAVCVRPATHTRSCMSTVLICLCVCWLFWFEVVVCLVVCLVGCWLFGCRLVLVYVQWCGMLLLLLIVVAVIFMLFTCLCTFVLTAFFRSHVYLSFSFCPLSLFFVRRTLQRRRLCPTRRSV